MLPQVHRESRIRLYVAAQTIIAVVAVGTALLYSGVDNWPVTLVLAAVCAVAERYAPEISDRLGVSVAFLPMVLAALLFGPAAAALAGAAGMALLPEPGLKMLSFVSSRALVGVAAGVGAQVVLAQASDPSGLGWLLLAAIAATLLSELVDVATASAVVYINRGISPLVLLRHARQTLLVSLAVYVPITSLYAYAYIGSGEWVIVFFAVPIAAAHVTLKALARSSQLISELEKANHRLAETNSQLQRINLSFTRAMVRALDARDNWTANHSTAVAAYSRDICREMGMAADVVERIHLIGMVHDVGKVAVPSEVLQKTSALTDEEWALMREHSAEGEKILLEVEGYEDIAAVVRSHHERWDGGGYPDNIAGDEIPELARIIAVADSYNAMTTARPYRGPMSPEEAIAELVRGIGAQFEEGPVLAFLAVLDREDDPYRMGTEFRDFTSAAAAHPELADDEPETHDIAA